MPDVLKRTIPVTTELSVLLYEDQDPRQGSYISIKHNTPQRGMEGEALIAPAQIPDLIKALTEAALELTQSINYFSGYSEGAKETLQTRSN
jgi:hypothetical protein